MNTKKLVLLQMTVMFKLKFFAKPQEMLQREIYESTKEQYILKNAVKNIEEKKIFTSLIMFGSSHPIARV